MARSKNATIDITAQNKMKAGLQDAMGELGKFGKVVEGLGKITIGAGIGAALYKIGETAKKCVDNFLETEDTYLRMAKSLNKEDYNKALKSINKFSRYTKASRDELAAMMSTMASMGKSSEEMDKITEAAIALSNVTGKDLNSSFEIMLDSLNGSTGEMEKFLPQVKNMSAEMKAAGGAIDEVIKKFGDLSKATSADSLSQVQKNMEDSMDRIGKSIGEILMMDLEEIFIWAEDWLDDLANRFDQMASDRRDVRNGTVNKNSSAWAFNRGIQTGTTFSPDNNLDEWKTDDLISIFERFQTEYKKENRKTFGRNERLLQEYERSFDYLGDELLARGIPTTAEDALNSLGDKIENGAANLDAVLEAFKYVPASSVNKAISNYESGQAGLKSPHMPLFDSELYNEFGNKLNVLGIAKASKASGGSIGDDEDAVASYFEETNKKIEAHSKEIDTFFENLTNLFSGNEINFKDPKVVKGLEDLEKLDNWLASLGAAGTLSGVATRTNAFQSWIEQLKDPDLPKFTDTTSLGTDLLHPFMSPEDYIALVHDNMKLTFDIPEAPKSKGSYWTFLSEIDETLRSFSSFLSPQTKAEELQYYADQKVIIQAQLDELKTYAGDNSAREKALLRVLDGIDKKTADIAKEAAAERKANREHNLVNDLPELWNNINGGDALENGILGSLMESFEGLFNAIQPIMMMLQNPIWTMIAEIFEGFVNVIAPAITQTIQPFFDTLAWIGETIGSLFLPIFDELYPFFTLIAQLLETIIAPVLQLISPFLQIIATILEVLRPILVAVAVAFEYIMAPVRWLGDLFSWCGEWIKTFGHNISTFVYNLAHPFRKRDYESGPGEFHSDAFSGLDERVAKLTELNAQHDAISGSTETAVQGATYNGAMTVTINNNFYAPVVGEDGMDQFATMIRDKFIELDYFGV